MYISELQFCIRILFSEDQVKGKRKLSEFWIYSDKESVKATQKVFEHHSFINHDSDCPGIAH